MKQLGIISIVYLWLGLILLIRKWKGNASMTFSQHAAQNRSSQIYYLGLFATGLVPYTLFLYGWFIPFYHMPFMFGLLIAISIAGMAVAAIVPETKGRNVTIHRFAAFLMADCFVPLLLIIAFSQQLPNAVRILAVISAGYQLFGISLLFPTKGYHPKVLPLQASYIAVFTLTIIAATYLR